MIFFHNFEGEIVRTYMTAKNIIIALFLVFFFSLNTFSQDEDETIITHQVWLDYHKYYKFKPEWELFGDIGYRFIPKDFEWQTFLVRPSIRYFASSRWEVMGGVGFFQTFNKDLPNSFEIRPWQGVRLKWPSFEPIFFSHYVRLEERIYFPQEAQVEFNFRFRYRIGVKINVYQSPSKNLIFIPGYAEVFVDFGPKIQETFSNRARFALGIGYKTNKNWTFEFHFVGQNGRSGQEEQFNTSERLYQFKVRKYLFKKEYRGSKSPDDF